VTSGTLTTPLGAPVGDRGGTPRAGHPGRAALLALAAQAVVLWPHAHFVIARWLDGSDEPLGLLAALCLGVWLMTRRQRLLNAPHWPWVAAAVTFSLLANASLLVLPSLAAGVLAAAAFTCMVCAWLPPGTARAPLAGLAVLSLPLVASLQFYVGYPLRVITAEASAWLLSAAGIDAVREGVAMTVRGQLVVVDAPCSGVQMAWMAYFTACAWAAFASTGDASNSARGRTHARSPQLLRRLPWVGVMVLTANAVRNSVLVALESRPSGLSTTAHEAIGLVALLAVCCAVVALMQGDGAMAPSTLESAPADARSLRRGGAPWQPNRHLRVLGCAAILAAGLLPMVTPNAWAHTTDTHALAQRTWTEWPTMLDGRPLRPLAPSAMEGRFVKHFPGSIARFDDGKRTWVLRHVTRPTRMLHPAADCFKAVGYRIRDTHLSREGRDTLWRCFVAHKGDEALRVCERIESHRLAQGTADGVGTGLASSFVDTSAWFWAASMGRTQGPWLALTRVEMAP
jgi:hypothetical protein